MVEGTDGHPAHHQWPARAPSKEDASPKYQISSVGGVTLKKLQKRHLFEMGKQRQC